MFTYRNIKWILLFVLCIIFQSIIVDNLLSIKGIRPNFIVIALIFYGLEFGGVYATIAGFFVGVIQGLGFFGGGFIGLASLTNSITGFYAGLFQRSGREYSDLFFFIIILTACFIHDFLYYYILLFGSETRVLFIILRSVLPTSLFTTIVGMMFLYSFKKRIN